LKKRGNSYRITACGGYDINGKQIRQRMTWKPEKGMTARQIEKEVQRQAVLFEEQCNKGQVLDGNIKLADFIEMYFKDYAEGNLKKKTIAGYKGLTPYVNQALGHLRIDKIQPHHLNAFYKNLSEVGGRKRVTYKPLLNFDELLKENKLSIKKTSELAGIGFNTVKSVLSCKPVSGKTVNAMCKLFKLKSNQAFEVIGKDEPLSPETIRHYHRFISSVLGVAVKWQLILSNPCERATLPKRKKTPPKYLDEQQAAQLLELVEKEDMQHKTMIKMFMYTGLRREELCGLEWKDINFENSVITVARASIYIPKEGIISDTTKNETSQRSIKAPTAAMQMLKDYRAWQSERRLLMGDRWQDYDRLFTTAEGKPIHPDTITGWFHDFLKVNDLPNITIHSLRHTNATLMINSGVPIPTIAARLGHANPSTTTKIYTHAIKSADAAAAETLDYIFSKKTDTDKRKHA
jgi:integrase